MHQDSQQLALRTFRLPSIQPVFSVLLAAQAFFVVCRFAVTDILGGATMAMITLLGAMTISPRGDGIDPSYAFCYTVLAIMQSLIDTAAAARCAAVLWELGYSVRALPPSRILWCTVAAMCPLIELATGILCHALLKDSTTLNERVSLLTLFHRSHRTSTSLADLHGYGTHTSPVRNTAKEIAQPAMSPFQGQSRKLADLLQSV